MFELTSRFHHTQFGKNITLTRAHILSMVLFSLLLFIPSMDTAAVPNWTDIGTGDSPAVVLNRYRYPVVVYSNGALMLATCADLMCPTTTTLVPGTTASAQPSLVLTASEQPVISYYNTITRDLMLAVCSNTTCTSTTVSVIDSTGDVGQYSSIRLTSSGLPVIAYYDATQRDLKAAFCGNLSCTTRTLQRVDFARDVGQFASLQINGSGQAVISYYNASTRRLDLAVCNNAICSKPKITTVDSSTNVGQYSSLGLMSSGRPVISYYDATNGNLKLAICNDLTCASPILRTVDSTGTVGQYTALTLDQNDRASISYYASTWRSSRLAVCMDTLCNSTQRQDIGSSSADRTALIRRNPQGVYMLWVNNLRRITLLEDIPTPTACYTDAPQNVDEGAIFGVTVRCDGLTAQVFGFELGLSSSGSVNAISMTYRPGTFVTNASTDVLEAVNRLDSYAVSRHNPALPVTGSFSLGSVEYRAPMVFQTTRVVINLTKLLLGDRQGGRLNVPVIPSVIITIRNVN